jgi:hypothetical protein
MVVGQPVKVGAGLAGGILGWFVSCGYSFC